MNINSELYEFKEQYGCTKCKQKILKNNRVIAHECNVKHCKYILCKKCHKELISTSVSNNNNEILDTLTPNKPIRSSRCSHAYDEYSE